MQSPVVDRFLRYVQVDTRSVSRVPGEKEVHPSSPGQLVLINMLLEELTEMMVPADWVQKLGDGSVLVSFPPTSGFEDVPHICFAAHVDTYPGCPGGAKPIVHQYMSGDIALPNGDSSKPIPASDLVGLDGKTIITADGTTLLGADDKAGVAALMTFIWSKMRGLVAHGPVTIWFCTDEEIGEVGTSFLPPGVADQWNIFLTVDGKELHIVDTGCFYGSKVDVEFIGVDAHPGVEGDKLCPAHYALARFIDRLGSRPHIATPWQTSGRESFIYVMSLPAGTAGKSAITVYPRTFQEEEFPRMRAIIKRVAKEAAVYYRCTVTVSELKTMYVNIALVIDAHPELLAPIWAAYRKAGIEPIPHHVRAGTDGAMFGAKYPNTPAPNLGTGAYNLHGLHEFVVVEHLDLLPSILDWVVRGYTNLVTYPA